MIEVHVKVTPPGVFFTFFMFFNVNEQLNMRRKHRFEKKFRNFFTLLSFCVLVTSLILTHSRSKHFPCLVLTPYWTMILQPKNWSMPLIQDTGELSDNRQ